MEAHPSAVLVEVVDQVATITLNDPRRRNAMTPALGDALAVSLLERRGFSADDYRQLHPGGKLGARLLKVEDLMHKGPEMPLIGADARMADAVLIMTEKRFGCVGVVEPPTAAGRLIGLVTDGDLRRHMAPDLLERIAQDASFCLTPADLELLTDPMRFVGRAPEQVDRFLESWVEPVLARHQNDARDRVGAPEVRV